MTERGRIRTYVQGLDEQLEGGIPEGYIVLIQGMPGTMKSSLAYSILYHNAKENGIPGLYISLEQNKDILLEHMKSLKMDHELVKDKLSVIDFGLVRKKIEGLKETNPAWLDVAKMYFKTMKKSSDYKLLVIDSLSVLEIIGRIENRRSELFKFFEWLRELNATTFLVSEAYSESNVVQGEDFLADGIIHLKMERLLRDEVNVQRRIRIAKMRSTNHNTSYFILVRSGDKFQITQLISE